jgi:hypothetical protein
MIRYVTVFVLSLFAVGAWAQTPAQQSHHVDVTVVDGAKNPELIPDSTAFRLWLVTVSPSSNSAEKDRAFQQAHFNQLQLLGADRLALMSVLTEFKTQYADLIARYNESAKAGLLNGTQVDTKAFLQQREELVSNTRIAIKNRLSSEAADRVEAHVQREKSRIKIHTTGGGEQP